VRSIASYRETLLGREYRVSLHSFFQVSTRPTHAEPPPGVTVPDWVRLPADGLSQADVLALLVLAGLDLHGGEAVLDAYCGVGTFALLAAEKAARVVGIEESRSAVGDAEENAMGLSGVTLHVGKAETVLPALGDTFDAVVLDPARVGCAPEALRALLERPPRRLVYVSCDLATLARDLKLLCESVYRVVAVQPLDMFPRTHHIECVATLERASP
jgi:23S rRNA (uracil1939-C5)-methyltransferase